MAIVPAPPDRRKPDFTLTMINIVFLLLLFFLTTGSLTNRNEARTGTPLTSDLPLERLPRPLLLLTREGELFLDGAAVDPAAVVSASAEALKATGMAGQRLNLLADREMPASTLLDLAEALRGGGIAVQLVTLHQVEAP